MAEATIESTPAPDSAALADLARTLDRARMKKIGSYHFAMAMGVLTLWGAGVTWAETTGWALAQLAAVANALIAGFVLPSLVHEWGHFSGARLSGAESPVLEAPRDHYFMFDFKMDQNNIEQFSWMSWGGILAPWALVVLALFLVPLSTLSGAVLFATLVARAVFVSVFEVPVVGESARTGDPGKALGQRVSAGGLDAGKRIGAIAGAVCFSFVWLLA